MSQHHLASLSQPVPLNSAHIADALNNSLDGGATLVLSKLNLSDVQVSAAEQLATIGVTRPDEESIVKRIALNHNKLTTLPMEFALLSQLRYLNLKHNNFKVFPDVLTLLPALDTLDISYNKIKRLPPQPGNFVGLRVLNLFKNKLARLPPYIAQFNQLEFLQLQENNLEWPPADILDQPKEGGPFMKGWIQGLRKWIEEGFTPKLNVDVNAKGKLGFEQGLEESHRPWKFPRVEQGDSSAHSRSVSADSSLPTPFNAGYKELVTPTPLNYADERPNLHLGILGGYSRETSPVHSIRSYLPSPAESESFDDRHTFRSNSTKPNSPQHSRDVSTADAISKPRTEFNGKTNIPDPKYPERGRTYRGDVPPLPHPVPTHRTKSDPFSAPSLISQRQNSSIGISSSASDTQTNPSMTTERNSYFRRVSTFPPHELPPSLLSLVESARTILFAVCQVHQALEHYVLYPIDDRLSSLLRRTLGPLNVRMTELINALDKFDSVGRRAQPSASICRGVVEGCKDTVTAFNKTLNVLFLQLTIINTCDDVRFSRRLFLEIYAAMAEISCAWQSFIPHLDSIRAVVHGRPYGHILTVHSPGSIETANGISGPTEVTALQPTLRPAVSLGLLSNRARIARRHAGSFSSRDVELGKKLPSFDVLSPVVGGVASKSLAPFPRAPKRHVTGPTTTASAIILSPSPIGSTSLPISREGSFQGSHSREGSQVSIPTSSVSSSPSLFQKTPLLEIPMISKTQIDREALQAVKQAIEVAPTVWDMMEELLSHLNLRGELDNARQVTKRLREALDVAHHSDPSVDRKTLRDDARTFLKIVIHLSNLIKTHGGNQIVSQRLRANMVKLTASTEEFAILLHVSSLSPSTGRLDSPAPSPSYQSNATPTSIQEDTRLLHSISRGGSAQASPKPLNHDHYSGLNPSFQMPNVFGHPRWNPDAHFVSPDGA